MRRGANSGGGHPASTRTPLARCSGGDDEPQAANSNQEIAASTRTPRLTKPRRVDPLQPQQVGLAGVLLVDVRDCLEDGCCPSTASTSAAGGRESGAGCSPAREMQWPSPLKPSCLTPRLSRASDSNAADIAFSHLLRRSCCSLARSTVTRLLARSSFLVVPPSCSLVAPPTASTPPPLPPCRSNLARPPPRLPCNSRHGTRFESKRIPTHGQQRRATREYSSPPVETLAYVAFCVLCVQASSLSPTQRQFLFQIRS